MIKMQAEIEALLCGRSIFQVFIYYKRAGKKIFELIGERNFLDKLLYPITFIGNYQGVAVFIDDRTGGICYKLLKNKDV